MSKTITPEAATDEATNYEESVNQMFSEMKRANEKMTRDQEDIDRLKAETSEILMRLKAA